MARRSSLPLITVVAIGGLSLAACGSTSLTPAATTAASKASSAASGAMGAVDAALAAKVPAKIKAAGKIVVGTDATYAPNEFLDSDGKTVVGMDVDIFNAVAAKLGLKTEYVPASFDSIILGVGSGKYDVGVSSFTINDKRKAEALMVSYFSAGTQWVTQKGNPKKVDPNNACGLKIGVQKGTVQADEDLPAKNKACTDAGKPPIELIVDGDQGKVTTSVLSGKADAMLADSPIGLYAVKQTSAQLEAIGDIYDAAPYGFVVAKDQKDFADAIAAALKATGTDGSYKAALAKWGQESGAVTAFVVNP
ncbi:MAG: ABC transporter substrate-binding protein [Candidatus Phosphoribacter sp.]